MIKVKLNKRKEDEVITSYSIEGHAFFAKPGKDIVCAGVSAVTVGTVNAIERLLQVQLPHQMEKGLLRVDVPQFPDQNELQSQVQLLLQSMLVMLQTIELSYGKHIRITQITE